MNIRTLQTRAQTGDLPPVVLLVGTERFLRDETVLALKKAALGSGPSAFNEDSFTAQEHSIDSVLSAVRTVPMMSPKRFVHVRMLERWDTSGAEALDALATYLAAPIDTTCLVLCAEKLDGRRKLVTVAKKQDILVACEPLSDRDLAVWIEDRVRVRGNTVASNVAEALAELVGPDLGIVDDAVERLCLYVGEGNTVDEQAVSDTITRIRSQDTWALVDAIATQDLARAFHIFGQVYDARDRGLPLLGAIAWSVRQLLRYQCAIAEGVSSFDAAKKAGAFNPGRARELESRAKLGSRSRTERWLLVLADADRSLKGSKRPAEATLEHLLIELCSA